MLTARYLAILAMVLIAGAATIAMAYEYAQMGGPFWQAALGPVLLGAFIAVRWLGRAK
jgi:hypothetical protein